MEQVRWSKYIVSLVYVVLGAIIIAQPTIIGKSFCIILAVTLAIIGGASIASYILTKVEHRVAEGNNGLAYGIILIVLAVFIMLQQELVISLIPFILGLMITIRGVMMIQYAVNLRRFGYGDFKVNLIIAALVTVFGLVIMLFPFEMANAFFIAMGVGLVFGGVMDIVANILMGRELKKFNKEMEE